MAEESTVEQPTLTKAPEETQAASTEDQAKALLAELQGIGVEKPEDLHGMAVASREAGRLANQLGEARQELQMLRGQMEAMKTQPRNQPAVDEYGNPTVDLSQFAKKDDIRGVLRSFYQEEIIGPQQRAMQEGLKQLAEIQADEDFGIVQPMWEKHFHNPNTQVALQTGNTTVSKEYQKLVRMTYREALKKSKGLAEAITKGGLKPPHIESGNTQTPIQPTDSSSRAKKIKDLTKPETRQGTDSELLDLVNAFMSG